MIFCRATELEIPAEWSDALDGAVNKRLLSTGESRELVRGDLASGLNPGGWVRHPANRSFQRERDVSAQKPAECGGYRRQPWRALLSR